ncbi:molybdenum ABC transporter ATP-binding protein [Oceanibaculum indicum]|uniref:Molybdenum transport protein modC n=1 Tax=Oceanibaculum indicum P24 TaxID=1207063 RepID=K2JE56_9PROT|nr:molybdenum ABC transporter ATP-binding protein [Oceanibaculum indicum]EKE68889.1 molybdenum transport protein modC [Oceanibaculum indicum P24]
MTLTVDVSHRQGDFTLEVRFESEGNLTALFGRSGSGKTTLVNIVAGLIRPVRGRVALGDLVLLDSERGIFVPPHRRRIGYVFQEGRLFPHLSVRQNLLYGRWFAPSGERREALDTVIDLLGIASLLERRPGSLSGGEKQRVAIGRALLASPRLLLMDEPLASLDEGRKGEILPYIERLRDQMRIPILYVSHAVGEVARLASTLVLLNEGRVAAAGPTADIMGRLDLFPMTGRAEAGAVLETRIEAHEADYGLTLLRSAAGMIRVPRIDMEAGTPVRVRIRARDVMLALERPSGISALNILEATVAELRPGKGPIVDIRLDCAGTPLLARVTRRSVETLGLRPGLALYAVVKSVAFERRSIAAGTEAGGEAGGEAADL